MLGNPRAMMLARIKTTRLDGDGDEWIQRNEFEMLMHNLFFFNKLIAIFSEIDTSGDGRVDFQEFVAGLDIIGFGITREQAWREFNKMDDDRGGLVVFNEFCSCERSWVPRTRISAVRLWHRVLVASSVGVSVLSGRHRPQRMLVLFADL